jgi:hypothetical protein
VAEVMEAAPKKKPVRKPRVKAAVKPKG